MSDTTNKAVRDERARGHADPVLSVRDLVIQFRVDGEYVTAVDGLSYDLHRGETLGIVGESGSGKSVTNLGVMGLLPVPPARILRGEIWFKDRDLLKLSKQEMRTIRGSEIAMIFQDPMTSLNPFLRVSQQLLEMVNQHQRLSKKQARELCIKMLDKVGIPDPQSRFTQYPHEFSGGMRQRVMIAMMLLNDPELLIADEPTTALDVTIQAQILELLKSLQKEFNTAITLITHDLGVVAGMADKIIVMYSGKIMESARGDDLFADPSHPYTLGLLKSIPRLDAEESEHLYSIPGIPPDLNNRPPGCPFAPRCTFVQDRCTEAFPELVSVGPEHMVACWEVDKVREDRLTHDAGGP